MMNIEISKKVNTVSAAAATTKSSVSKENDGKFAKELKSLKEEKKTEESKKTTETAKTKDTKTKSTEKQEKTEAASKEKSEKVSDKQDTTSEDIDKLVEEDDFNVGEIEDIDEKTTKIAEEDIIIPENIAKKEKDLKLKEKNLELNPETTDIEEDVQTIKSLQTNSEHINAHKNDVQKVDVKPEAQVSITKPDFESEIDETVLKSDKSAKYERQQNQDKLKSENEKEEGFKNIIENTTENIQENKGKSNQKHDEIEIDESLVETTKVISGLENAVKEISKLNRTNEKQGHKIQNDIDFADKKEKTEDKTLIDNNMNIQDISDKNLPQMNANMNFNSDGQPFAEFVTPKKEELKTNKKDLAEEQAILSTMAENIAIANQNMLNIKPEENIVQKVDKKSAAKPTKPVETILQTVLQDEPDEVQEVQSKTKTVTTDEGVKKVDRKTNVVVETVVKFDSVIMDEADVEFFTKLVNEGTVDMSEVKNAEKSSRVSKSLADLLAKAMQDNKPVRIDFDNNISVIIKIGKDGKISADFLPSSQVAEAYLKENLPLLKQKLDDNNIEYDELNQRKQKQDNQENRKKGRKDE